MVTPPTPRASEAPNSCSGHWGPELNGSIPRAYAAPSLPLFAKKGSLFPSLVLQVEQLRVNLTSLHTLLGPATAPGAEAAATCLRSVQSELEALVGSVQACRRQLQVGAGTNSPTPASGPTSPKPFPAAPRGPGIAQLTVGCSALVLPCGILAHRMDKLTAERDRLRTELRRATASATPAAVPSQADVLEATGMADGTGEGEQEGVFATSGFAPCLQQVEKLRTGLMGVQALLGHASAAAVSDIEQEVSNTVQTLVSQVCPSPRCCVWHQGCSQAYVSQQRFGSSGCPGNGWPLAWTVCSGQRLSVTIVYVAVRVIFFGGGKCV